MNREQLQQRTKQLALRILRLACDLDRQRSTETWAIAKQIVRCGTSVGANYRAACRARSKADFVAKLGIVEEEADETSYWLELLIESGLMKPGLIQPLLDEADEIVAIISASRKTARVGVESKRSH